MMKLDRNNYEMIMFDLLEGNIKEPERSDVIRQIEADTFYTIEWENWQKTILPPDNDMVFPMHKVLKKPEGGMIVKFPFLRYAAAACIIMGAAFAVYRFTTGNHQEIPVAAEVSGNGKGKKPVKQTPALTADTTRNLRNEVSNMASETTGTREKTPAKAPEKRKPLQEDRPMPESELPVVHNIPEAEQTPMQEMNPKPNLLPEKNEPVVNALANNDVKVIVTQETIPQNEQGNDPLAVISEKGKQLKSLFKKPKVSLEKSENKGYNVVIQNEDYKLIAGF